MVLRPPGRGLINHIIPLRPIALLLVSSNSSSTVGYKFTTSNGTPTSYFYCFYFQNNTSSSFDYDVSSLINLSSYNCPTPATIDGGEPSGTVPPQSEVSVSFTVTSIWDNADNNTAALSLQAAAAPLITNLAGYTVCFWFSTDGANADYQQIAICQTGNGTTLPISSAATQTSTQQIYESADTYLSIGLGANEEALTTSYIWIQVWDLDQTP
jgi:hypothetical protein